MADVFQFARQYRSRLRSELAKVEDFIRMADVLASDAGMETPLALVQRDPRPRYDPAGIPATGQTAPRFSLA